MMRWKAKAGVVAILLLLVGVVEGCGAPPTGKGSDLALDEDESTGVDKKKTDSPEGTSETIELGSGTKGTEPDPEQARSEGEEGDDATSKPAPAVCATDAQCNQAGRICTAGSCVKGCRNTAGCPTNQLCQAGQCALDDANVECYWDYDCDYGTICKADTCIAGCYTSADCPTGQTCTAGQCKVTSSTTPGTPLPATPQCVSDGQCNPGVNGSGKICSAQGTCVPGCHRDNQCPGSKICVTGACK